MNLTNLTGQVEYILASIPETRNSDITLMIEIWKRFYSKNIKYVRDTDECVLLKDLYDLPREDNIKRIRAKFQNDKKNPQYLPTDQKIAEQRGILAEVWREAMGHTPTTFQRI